MLRISDVFYITVRRVRTHTLMVSPAVFSRRKKEFCSLGMFLSGSLLNSAGLHKLYVCFCSFFITLGFVQNKNKDGITDRKSHRTNILQH